MKSLFVTVIISLATAISAHAATANADVQDLAKKAQVSDHCAAQILAQTTSACNKESKAKEGRNREHECFYSYQLSGQFHGALDVVFTVGDADEWTYTVSISDESDANSCDFTIKSAN